MRPFLLILLVGINVSAQSKHYDRFSDTHYVSSKEIEVHKGHAPGVLRVLIVDPSRVRMQAVRAYREPRAEGLERIVLGFNVDSLRWQFIEACVIEVIADGKRLSWTCKLESYRAKTAGGYGRSRPTYYVNEKLMVVFTVKEFTDVFNAQSIEMRVGPHTFTLKDKHLKELRKVIP